MCTSTVKLESILKIDSVKWDSVNWNSLCKNALFCHAVDFQVSCRPKIDNSFSERIKTYLNHIELRNVVKISREGHFFYIKIIFSGRTHTTTIKRTLTRRMRRLIQ